jgi:hypothetical protein
MELISLKLHRLPSDGNSTVKTYTVTEMEKVFAVCTRNKNLLRCALR